MGLLNLLLPRTCVGCEAPDTRWCPACARTLDLRTVERGAIATPAYALAPYGGPARRLVIAYKDRGRRELAATMGGAFAAGLIRLARPEPPWAEDVWLIPAPSRRSATRRRGGNHMLLAAAHACRELARLGVPAHVAPALSMAGPTRDSVGLSPGQRAANLRGAVSVDRRDAPPAGTPVVLVDDVVTTGTTIAECTLALDKADIPVAAVLAFTATV